MEKTEVSVVLYDTKSGSKLALADLCKRDIQIPPTFSLKGGVRKFIVLVSEDRSEVAIAIGELLDDSEYYHKDILSRSRSDFSGLRISGGGSVEFTLSRHSLSFAAEFYGKSGDFGVFDQVLLKNEVAQAVANAIKMNVSVKMELGAYARFHE